MADLKKKYPSEARKLTEVKDINDLYVFMLSKNNSVDFASFNQICTILWSMLHNLIFNLMLPFA